MSNPFTPAHIVVDELCDGKRDWVMGIPANPERDPDLIIGAALHAGEQAFYALDRILKARRATMAAAALGGEAFDRAQEETQAAIREAEVLMLALGGAR